MFLACDFDSFAYNCKHFTSKSKVNNGYGCTHKNQEEVDYDDDLERMHGKCYCYSCPLGLEADEESLRADDVDWNGLEPTEIGESEYLLVRFDSAATPDEKEAVLAYDKYQHRYDTPYRTELARVIAQYPDEPAHKLLFRVRQPQLLAFVEKNIMPSFRCFRCGTVLVRETEPEIDYPYVCLSCDENMYSSESREGTHYTTDELMKVCYAALANKDILLDETEDAVSAQSKDV